MIPERKRTLQSLTPARKKRLLRPSSGISQMSLRKQNEWRIEMNFNRLNPTDAIAAGGATQGGSYGDYEER